MNTKICKRCDKEFPATLEYFHKSPITEDGFHIYCKACRKITSKKWRAKYYQRTKEEASATHKIYYAENKETISAQSKAWYQAHKDRAKTCQQEYFKKNKEHIKQLRKRWTQNNTDRIRASWRKATGKRQKLLNSLVNNLTEDQWNACLKYFNNSCAYCGDNSNFLEKEHFIPLTKGGKLDSTNTIPACKKCNSSKSNKDFIVWFPQQKHFSNKSQDKIINYLFR